MKLQKLLIVIFLILLVGCVSAPRETVELSEIVDQQIAEMQISHEKFVRLYYDKLRDEIDNFLVQRWIPNFLSKVVGGEGSGGKKFREDLDVAYVLSDFDWKSAINLDSIDNQLARDAALKTFEDLTKKNNATLGKVLLDFSEGVQTEIHKMRHSLIKPINDQEEFIINQLKDSYADLLRSSLSIKAYLSSTVEIVEQQDTILNKLGVLETKKDLINKAIEFNDQAVELIDQADDVEEGIDKFIEFMDEAKKKIEGIKKGE